LRRSEIWLAEITPKARPVVIVSRESHVAVRRLVMVARVTSRARGLETEVALGPEEGLAVSCVADAGTLELVGKDKLRRRLGFLSSPKRDELDAALRFAVGLDEP
jgi:mRNA-degrading endonuclease toxin of MazEF toxin-antitoxin module